MRMYAAEPLPEISEIQRRLEVIFPDGTPDRNYLVRDVAARIIFTMLYIDAVEGQNQWLAPKHVYRMGEDVATKQSEDDRRAYLAAVQKKGGQPSETPWYSDNSREQIRDESLRDGLVMIGVVEVLKDVPTTSSRGRYALKRHFAELFVLPESEFMDKVREWQNTHLSASALGRVRIMQQRQGQEGQVSVDMLNGERRVMEAGPSSWITKAVIEEFCPRFLKAPAVVWISSSGNKVIAHDDQLMKDLGLPINEKTLLPDLVVADLDGNATKIVFAEVVATDGPITEDRKKRFLELATSAGYAPEDLVFVSAFSDRNSSALKRRFSGIAVDTLIWCVAEPDLLLWMQERSELPVSRTDWQPFVE